MILRDMIDDCMNRGAVMNVVDLVRGELPELYHEACYMVVNREFRLALESNSCSVHSVSIYIDEDGASMDVTGELKHMHDIANVDISYTEELTIDETLAAIIIYILI